MMNMMEQYKKNKNFREYVDHYCKTYNRTVEEALNHALIQEVARYYTDNNNLQAEKSTYALMGECV